MLKIATHDSATGEKPANLLSRIVLPFSRTQSKTIKQQYEAGCRLFDIRARKVGGLYKCAHGIFQTERSAFDILLEIDKFPEACYVLLTYEGRLDKEETESFKSSVKIWQAMFKNILWGAVCVKYTDSRIFVKYGEVLPATCQMPPTRQGFLPLDGKTWQTYLPIPWLWKKIYHNRPAFDENVYTFVDFL